MGIKNDLNISKYCFGHQTVVIWASIRVRMDNQMVILFSDRCTVLKQYEYNCRKKVLSDLSTNFLLCRLLVYQVRFVQNNNLLSLFLSLQWMGRVFFYWWICLFQTEWSWAMRELTQQGARTEYIYSIYHRPPTRTAHSTLGRSRLRLPVEVWRTYILWWHTKRDGAFLSTRWTIDEPRKKIP